MATGQRAIYAPPNLRSKANREFLGLHPKPTANKIMSQFVNDDERTDQREKREKGENNVRGFSGHGLVSPIRAARNGGRLHQC